MDREAQRREVDENYALFSCARWAHFCLSIVANTLFFAIAWSFVSLINPRRRFDTPLKF